MSLCLPARRSAAARSCSLLVERSRDKKTCGAAGTCCDARKRVCKTDSVPTGNEAQNRRALDLLLEDIPAEPCDRGAAAAYGPLRSAVRNRKKDALDKLIAAHAIGLDVTLVSNNEADFAGYPWLRVENWVSPNT